MSVFPLIKLLSGRKKNNGQRVELRKLRVEALEERRMLSADGIIDVSQFIGSDKDGNYIIVNSNIDNITPNTDDGQVSLREAINAINNKIKTSQGYLLNRIKFNLSDGNETITLLSQLTISKSMTIDGSLSDNKNVILDGNETNRIIWANSTNLTLKYLTLQNGKVENSNGGAILFDTNTGMLTLNNVKLLGNKALHSENSAVGGEGGAIYITRHLTIENCEFTDNHAVKGGAIYYKTTANISTELTSVTLSNNEATDGGAIYIYSGTFTVHGGNFHGNTATNGGAVYSCTGHTLTFDTFTNFNNNTAEKGGALYNIPQSSNTTNLSNITMIGNEATYGGAIYHGSKNLKLSDVSLISNVATQDGGALFIASGSVSASGASFTDNGKENGDANIITTINGGAVYLHSGTFLANSETSFKSNAAKKYGGAVYINGGTFTVEDGKFEKNKATRGGAIANFVGTGTNYAVSINGTTFFTDNNAIPLVDEASRGGFGGAIYNVGSIAIGLSDSDKHTTFSGNVAGEPIVGTAFQGYSGGAIYNSTSGNKTGRIDVYNVDFTNNFAGKYGGAVSNFASFSASNSTFTNNIASVGGAVQTAGTATFINATFTSNKALRSKNSLDGENDFGGNGGAIFASGGGKSITFNGETTFNSNQAANVGGAIDVVSGVVAFADTITIQNNVAGTLGGAVVLASVPEFTQTTFDVGNNTLRSVNSPTSDVFHKSVGRSGLSRAKNVAITSDIGDQFINTIATTIFGADAYMTEGDDAGELNPEKVYTFASYRFLTSNVLSYADLASSFATPPQRIVVTVDDGGKSSLTNDSGAAILLEKEEGAPEGPFVVTYWDAAHQDVPPCTLNILVKDQTSVIFSQLQLPNGFVPEGESSAGTGSFVGVNIRIHSDSNKPVDKWTFDWGSDAATQTTEIEECGFTCNAYNFYASSGTYDLKLTAKNGNRTIDYGVIGQIIVSDSESTQGTGGAVLDVDADFFADLELVDELFES